jgi:hypothetical protein
MGDLTDAIPAEHARRSCDPEGLGPACDDLTRGGSPLEFRKDDDECGGRVLSFYADESGSCRNVEVSTWHGGPAPYGLAIEPW